MLTTFRPPLPHLAVVDDCLAPMAETSLSGARVARELDRLMNERGKPKMVVSDNGSELISNADPTIADAVLDRLVHNAHRLALKGDSMRKITAQRAILDATKKT